MNSIKSEGLEIKKKNTSMKIFKTSMTLLLIVFAFSVASPYFSFQLIKPVMAGTLAGVSVFPASNLVNERETYEIFLITATTATIKTIEMTFPSSIDLSAANKVIERSGIGHGTISATGSTLKYTVSSPVSVPASTTIRLEIGKIVATVPGFFSISIRTLNTADSIIDGPTTSVSILIKAIEGLDISPYFMNRTTLRDDTAGHARGWDPNGATTDFTITDGDVQIDEEAVDQTFVTVMLRNSHTSNAVCMVNHTDLGHFFMNCIAAPPNGAQLHYEIHKLPAHGFDSTSTSTSSSTTSSTISSPFSLLGLGEH